MDGSPPAALHTSRNHRATRRVAQALARLRSTPLHPQWLLRATQRALEHGLRALPADSVVLDIGCADQWPRARLPEGCRYVGLDLRSTAVEWYGTRPQVYGSADALPLGAGSVSVVLLLDVLEHLGDEHVAMAEVARVLAPGGRAIVRVPFLYPVHDAPRDFRRLTRFALAALAARHGLELHSRQAFGRGLESAALIANLCIARTVLTAWRGRRPGLVLAPALLALVPLLNLVAWASAWLDADADFAPFSETVVFRRPGAAG